MYMSCFGLSPNVTFASFITTTLLHIFLEDCHTSK